MWLVRIALQRPYTFVVMAMLVVIVGIFQILRMPTDIFPEIDIPVISLIFNYGGLPPEEMERRIVSPFERNLTTTVNDIEHIESQCLTGVAVVKVFFQPGADLSAATAQITAFSQPAVRTMPPGATPPYLIRYSASNVPIMQAALESGTLAEQQLFDFATNFVRADLATIHGAQIPWPYGGKQRQIMVDLDPPRLFAAGLSPREVTTALATQNVVLPTGTTKLGTNEYPVVLNASPEAIQGIADFPLKSKDGKTVYLRDVASVRDGSSPQTNMVHVGGRRSVLLSILKNGSASTLDIASRVKAKLPTIAAKLPKELEIRLLFDQSLFVRAAVEGVVKEAGIAAALTALMILLFLGSWRSTIVVLVSIPLSILVSIMALGALGFTLNVMTLGGLALAVGILVDDATVEVENIHRNHHQGKTLVRAIMDGAQQIAVPAFVSTLCICIVFVPVGFISGAAKSLFVPLALAVVFAMMTSYLLSRTLVPTLVRYLLAKEAEPGHQPHRFFQAFDRGFARFRDAYGSWLAWALAHQKAVVGSFLVLTALSVSLFPLIGRDFFPNVDAGLVKLHVRGPPGTRIEESEKRFAAVEETVKSVIPEQEIASLIDNIGTPYSGINLSLSEGALISPADGQIMIALRHGHAPTADYVRTLRKRLAEKHPDTTFFFLAPDISTQVLNFGLPAPIDVMVTGAPGADRDNLAYAKKILGRVAAIPGAVDVHLAQVTDVPQVRVDVDRTAARQVGVTQRDVASDLLVSLSSSGQTEPSYWLDPRRGIQYLVAVQTPQWAIDSFEDMRTTPVSTPDVGMQLLSNVASLSRTTGPQNITHFDATRSYDVQANVDGTDLGSVATRVRAVVAELAPEAPRGTTVRIRGQIESMESSFTGLGYGLLFAVLLVYLLMVVNFQSWLDPLVILMALPGALSGIAWMLFLTHTTVSVPALMGAIMCVGVATTNSILVVTFANEQRRQGRVVGEAALAAGMTRLRPVIMTAIAMIVGMLPMSLGVGEGGEQNAPLGRAVIGGLLMATFATLFFVPVMYDLLRKRELRSDPEVESL